MNDVVALNTINNNDEYVIYKINANGIMRRRLMDIGIVPGSNITLALKSPSKNPNAYLIKGSLIALRNSDASNILVKKI